MMARVLVVVDALHVERREVPRRAVAQEDLRDGVMGDDGMMMWDDDGAMMG